MPFAIALFLDERSDLIVRQIWAALDDHYVTSLGRIANSDYHPHVTLSVFEHGDTEQLFGILHPIAQQTVGLPLPLAALGFFLTEEAPAFLGVIPSSRFLSVHRAVHDAIKPVVDGIWPYYRPDALLPHCTLAVGVTDKARVIDVVSQFTLPIDALAASAQLVEISGGHKRTSLTTT